MEPVVTNNPVNHEQPLIMVKQQGIRPMKGSCNNSSQEPAGIVVEKETMLRDARDKRAILKIEIPELLGPSVGREKAQVAGVLQ